MVYHAGGMLLDPIGEVLRGPVNDVLICRDLKSHLGMCYYLLLIHDRRCVKSLLSVFEDGERTVPGGVEPYLLRFTQNELLGYVFPFREERRLTAFSAGQLTTVQLRERVCVNLVMECLSTPLPYPLVYLALTQERVCMEKDGSVYFLPALDLSELDPNKGEAQCVSACARVLLELLEGALPRRKKLKSYELIRKKLAKRTYCGFPELYHDIKVTAVEDYKTGLWARLKGFWRRNKDRVFHILLVICVAVVVLSLVFLICQLIFGDIPFLRIFERAFEVIGTERLT